MNIKVEVKLSRKEVIELYFMAISALFFIFLVSFGIVMIVEFRIHN